MIHFAGTLGFGDLASLAGDESLFAATATEKLERLQAELQPLAERYDVVVANPPYMGSSSLGKWNGKWIKDNFPEAYRDLCTSFIDRGFSLSNNQGYSAMVTMQSWMFLGSYEKLRGKLLRNHTISSMAHLGTRAFGAIGGEVVSTTATVFANKKYDVPGTYLRLVDMGSEQEKAAGALEALANPNCGWFYRCNSGVFSEVPGVPIVYWASDAAINAFKKGVPVSAIGQPRVGLQTGENARFVRQWWEVSLSREWFECPSVEESIRSRKKWFPYNKGGEYRKWYGNNDCVVNWENDGYEIRHYKDSKGKLLSRPQNTQCYFKPCITWSKISSGSIAFRYKPQGYVFDVAGTSIFADETQLKYLHGVCNSSVILQIAGMLSPTLNFEVGQIATYPVINSPTKGAGICELVDDNRLLVKRDWDSAETSWAFEHHPLL